MNMSANGGSHTMNGKYDKLPTQRRSNGVHHHQHKELTVDLGDSSKYQKARRKRRQARRRLIFNISAMCAWILIVAGMWMLLKSHWESSEADRFKTHLRRAKWIRDVARGKVDTRHAARERLESPQEAEKYFANKFHYKGHKDDDAEARDAKPLDPSVIDHIKQLFGELNQQMLENTNVGIRWAQAKLLKELPGAEQVNDVLQQQGFQGGRKKKEAFKDSHNAQIIGELKKKDRHVDKQGMFKVERMNQATMAWEQEWKKMKANPEQYNDLKPKTDYRTIDYQYPELQMAPPSAGGYPELTPLGDIYAKFPQDDLDNPPSPFVEKLLHFNYSNPEERAAAIRFRDAELPFKVYDVPEFHETTKKWTDDYVSHYFDDGHKTSQFPTSMPRANGVAQESVDNFFAFFTPPGWFLESMGLPPSRNNDWTFHQWSEHAKYADAAGLDFDKPHFYWQAGAPRSERYENKRQWSFISRDLPNMSSTEANFFQWEPDEQKGIQCRFGERGVTAATHYDGGRNMVAMLTGAKRYILSPPNQCSKLGIVTKRGNAIFRHSLLNFGHVSYLDSEEGKNMPQQERDWLERAKTGMSIDTILKEGEVLYIPSHWFHYITSVQKSAQCNVRSGIHKEGTAEFGGRRVVEICEEQE